MAQKKTIPWWQRVFGYSSMEPRAGGANETARDIGSRFADPQLDSPTWAGIKSVGRGIAKGIPSWANVKSVARGVAGEIPSHGLKSAAPSYMLNRAMVGLGNRMTPLVVPENAPTTAMVGEAGRMAGRRAYTPGMDTALGANTPIPNTPARGVFQESPLQPRGVFQGGGLWRPGMPMTQPSDAPMTVQDERNNDALRAKNAYDENIRKFSYIKDNEMVGGGRSLAVNTSSPAAQARYKKQIEKFKSEEWGPKSEQRRAQDRIAAREVGPAKERMSSREKVAMIEGKSRIEQERIKGDYERDKAELGAASAERIAKYEADSTKMGEMLKAVTYQGEFSMDDWNKVSQAEKLPQAEKDRIGSKLSAASAEIAKGRQYIASKGRTPESLAYAQKVIKDKYGIDYDFS